MRAEVQASISASPSERFESPHLRKVGALHSPRRCRPPPLVGKPTPPRAPTAGPKARRFAHRRSERPSGKRQRRVTGRASGGPGEPGRPAALLVVSGGRRRAVTAASSRSARPAPPSQTTGQPGHVVVIVNVKGVEVYHLPATPPRAPGRAAAGARSPGTTTSGRRRRSQVTRWPSYMS